MGHNGLPLEPYSNSFNMKKEIVLFVLGMVFLKGNAQTGIGTTTPHASAKLEVYATNKGFLPPRITLTGTADTSTISSPATGLLIYNTATAGTSPSNVTPGYYYYNGSAWIAIIGSSTTGSLAGNGTTTTLSNFSAALNDQTGTAYTLTNSDNGKIITFNNASAITVTVPSLSVGFNCMILQKGTGQVVLSASGSTINNRYGFTRTAGQYSVLNLMCISSAVYVSSGDMTN